MKRFVALLGLGVAFAGVWFASAMVQSDRADKTLKAQSGKVEKSSAKIEYAFLVEKRKHNDSELTEAYLKGASKESENAFKPFLFEYQRDGDGYFSDERGLLLRLNELGQQGWEIVERNYPYQGDFLLKRELKD